MKILTHKKGFTLAELLVAIFIFGFMVAGLASIFSTANKHMFQSYRKNIVQSEASVAMKTIVNNLMSATRVDSPGLGTAGNILAFAVNIDPQGCYPINTAEPVSWHYFCVNSGILYHHFRNIPAGAGCPNGAAWTPMTNYPVSCGPPATRGETVMQLTENVANPINAPRWPFVRTAVDLVTVQLRVFWQASTAGLQRTSRDVDSTLTTTIRINSGAQ